MFRSYTLCCLCSSALSTSDLSQTRLERVGKLRYDSHFYPHLRISFYSSPVPKSLQCDLKRFLVTTKLVTTVAVLQELLHQECALYSTNELTYRPFLFCKCISAVVIQTIF